MTADPFALLNVPRRFHIDADALRRSYLAATLAAHPDRAGADPTQQADAVRRSAELNHAHQLVQDPLQRAEWLLASAGGVDANADKTVAPALLMQVMTWREELLEEPAASARVAQHVDEQTAVLWQQVAPLADRCTAGVADADALRSLRHALNSLKTLRRLRTDLP